MSRGRASESAGRRGQRRCCRRRRRPTPSTIGPIRRAACSRSSTTAPAPSANTGRRGAILPIGDARHEVGADDERVLRPTRLDLGAADGEGGEEARARRADVKRAGARGPERVRHQRRRVGQHLVGGRRRDQHQVELLGSTPARSALRGRPARRASSAAPAARPSGARGYRCGGRSSPHRRPAGRRSPSSAPWSGHADSDRGDRRAAAGDHWRQGLTGARGRGHVFNPEGITLGMRARWRPNPTGGGYGESRGPPQTGVVQARLRTRGATAQPPPWRPDRDAQACAWAS